MINPWYKALLMAIDAEAADYFLGKISLEEAVAKADHTFQRIIKTANFKREIENYFDKFIDVKEIE